MSEDAELQARIAALSNRITSQKQPHTITRARPIQSPSRWSPYTTAHTQYPAPYGARGGHKPGFRNRTLVNASNKTTGDVTHNGTNSPEPSTISNPGVTTHDRGRMQWTNAAVFDKKAQAKTVAIEETIKAKRQAREDRQKAKVVQHVYGAQHAGELEVKRTVTQDTTPREIVVHDLRFRVATNGSKLIRVFDGLDNDPQTTPKEAKVAGVSFVRTKHGNMVRQGLLRNQRENAGTTIKKLCPDFTSTGACIRGNRCRYKHDINKLAICKEYLRRGDCAAGEAACNLSHDPSPHRIPICLHFLRNNCTKPECRFAHLHVSPTAPVCRDFARLGYCERGAACTQRHLSECPDYTNTGVCRNRKCRLPHVDRAETLRKAAAFKTGKNSSDDDMTLDVSSDDDDHEEIDSDDADSDEIEEDTPMTGSGDNGHDLSQQKDFVSFK